MQINLTSKKLSNLSANSDAMLMPVSTSIKNPDLLTSASET